MLKIKNITKIYNRAGLPFKAVNNVNLEIKEGDFIRVENQLYLI